MKIPGGPLRRFDFYSALVGAAIIAGGYFTPDPWWVFVPIIGAIALIAGGIYAGIVR